MTHAALASRTQIMAKRLNALPGVSSSCAAAPIPTVLVDVGNVGSLAFVRRVFAGGVEAGDTENDQPLSTITRCKTFHSVHPLASPSPNPSATASHATGCGFYS